MNNKDIYWFTHDTNAKDDPKCAMMIEQFGPEAYGIFWILLEILREQPDFCYPLALIPSIARKYNTTKEKVTAVITAYGLFEIRDEKFFYSKSLINRTLEFKEKKDRRSAAALKGAMAKWEKEREKQKLLAENNANAMQTQCDSNAIADAVAMPIKNIKEINNIDSSLHSESSSSLSPRDDSVIELFDEDIAVKPKDITPDQFKEMWNAGRGKLPKVATLTEERKRKAKLRIAEFGKTPQEQTATITDIMHHIAASEFLQATWGKCNFDWLISNGSNWVKVIEGNYDNKKGGESKYTNEKWND